MKNFFLRAGRLAGASLKTALLVGLLGLLTTGSGWAMNPFSKIVLAPRQEAYVPVTGGTAVAAVQANDAVSGSLPLGFDFKFDGGSYDAVYASSNGFLSFNPNVIPAPANDLAAPDFDTTPLLAALWDDLDGTGGTASYRTTGAAGSRVFTFEWRNWKWGPTATGANISFQARLYEGSNRIEYACTGVGATPPAVTGDGASIGLSDGNAFLALDGTGPNPSRDFDVAHDDLTTPPANGQVYALVPPAPPANDDCAGAVLLTVAPATADPCANAYNASNLNATVSGSSVPRTCGTEPDTWYRFVAPASGAVRVKVSNITADLEVYGGSCGSLSSVNCNNNGNPNGNAITGLTPGALHYLRLSPFSNFINDPYTLCISALDAAPTLNNNDCTSATLLPVSVATCNPTNGTLTGATLSSTAAPSCDAQIPSDVWYRFMVPTGGQAVVRASLGSAVNPTSAPAVAVYSGGCSGLTEIGCSVYSNNAFFGTVNVSGRTVGETLYVRVWNSFGSTSGTFGICVSDGSPGDLVVNTIGRNIGGGPYRNVTITGTGVGALTSDLTVNNALVVQDGGELNTDTYAVTGPGSFTVQAGGILALHNSLGIGTGSTTGAVRVSGSRSLSADASYTYRVEPGYVTGAGLPATVRNLYVNTDVDANFDIPQFPGPGNLTLSAPVAVRQRLRLKRDLTTSSTNLLTLLSTPTQGTALIFNEADGAPAFPPNTPTPPGQVNGPVRVQRAIDPSRNAGVGYRHYAPPVAGATVASLTTSSFTPTLNTLYNGSAVPGTVSPFPTVYGYNEQRVVTSPGLTFSPFDRGWESPAALTSPLTVGRGYTVNLGGSQLVSFTGPPTQTDVTQTLARTTGPDAGWHLLGNPFPSPLDWSQVSIPANLGAAMYAYESSSQYAGMYRSYVNGIGNAIIPSSQGFFVREVGNAGSTATLTLPSAARVTEFDAAGSTFRRPAADPRPLLQLALRPANGSVGDATTVYFEAGASPATDAAYDAAKILNPGLPSVFSLNGTERLAINGLAPAPGAATTVELGLTVPQAGTYVLSADALNNLAPNGYANVLLLDRRTGTQTPLTQPGAGYPFALTAADLNPLGRFALLFNPGAAPLATNPVALAAQISVFPNPAHGRFALAVPALPGMAAVQVLLGNALGQPAQAPRTLPLTAAGATAEFATAGLAPGVYWLRVLAPGLAPVVKRVVVE